MADERVCVRCGTAAGTGWFCQACGLKLTTQRELPTRAEWAAHAHPLPGAFSVKERTQPVTSLYWLAFVGLALAGLALVVYVIDALRWINAVNAILSSASTGAVTVAQLVAGTDARSAASRALGFVYFGLAASGICFLIWFRTAYKRLAERGASLRFSSGWALGSWFVPILGLWRPKQIVNDLWRATRRSGLTVVNWWWGLYLGAGCVFLIGVLLSRSHNATFTAVQVLQTQRAGFWISIVGCLLYVSAGVLAALIVWRISEPEH